MRIKHWAILFIFISGCATLSVMKWDDLYGVSTPENRLNATPITQEQLATFHKDVQPIIENRCVVCHGCFDAPCQLKMESPEGIARGGSKIKIYDSNRLRAIDPTYLLGNAQTLASWRDKDFFPVLNERDQTPEANTNGSVLYQMLKLKKDNPLPHAKVLDSSFDFSLDRDQQCPSIEEFDGYKAKTPLGGMPYGLPGLSTKEHDTLVSWLAAGAKLPTEKPLSEHERAMVKKWEAFLNGDSLKEQLMSRYLYEHLYLANLYFTPERNRYFTLVRSYTPPGEKIKLVLGRRPFDDPKADRIYYRIHVSDTATIVKRHMPYPFDDAKLQRIKELFITPGYEVTKLPSYEIAQASNPFLTFEAIPVKSRYKFMLEEAQFSIMNFIKGPSCRGQVALNVIEDHFWVFFTDPDNIKHYQVEEFIDSNEDLLKLPAATSGNVLNIIDWRDYANAQDKFLKKQLEHLKKLQVRKSDVDLDLLWTGKGNKNAALTVYRNFDSAVVIKGAVGKKPKTSWVINYSLIERIHYLLVAGFDIYGNVAHQLQSRLYMDFLRMQGEANFIAFLPQASREETYKYWYRDTNAEMLEYIFSDNINTIPESNISYNTDNPQQELYDQLEAHTKASLNHSYELSNDGLNTYKIKRLNNLSGQYVYILPQLSYLMVENEHDNEVFTLVNNSGHTNVAHLFSEKERRVKAEDYVDVLKGIIGSYPNAFFKVKGADLPHFINDIELIRSEDDYSRFKDKYGVRRTDPNFWTFSDELHQWFKLNQPQEYGLLDYNRFENR